METVSDYYALLGVEPTATAEDIRKAYRTAASRFHPDVNHASAASLVFQEISTAYETLNDPGKRAEYDAAFSQTGNDRKLNTTTVLSRTAIPVLSEPQLVYAMLTLEAPSFQENAGAGGTPLNLALVIDRSTSMKGPRLDRVKTATHNIIENLRDEDFVSIVSFSDRAEVVISATRPTDRRTMKATVSTMRASGATAMYEGLRSGLAEMSKSLLPSYISHLVLITDGHTYGDEDECLQLADEAREQGISISAMGIGQDWNDEFLDRLAARTGGSSEYIASHRGVTAFLEERIRSLGTAYAERAGLVAAPAAGVELDSAFRVSPDPAPLDVTSQPIALGLLDAAVPTSVILQFSVTNQPEGNTELNLGRALVRAEILGSQRFESSVADMTVRISQNPGMQQPPPPLVEALSKVTLYRLQEHARSALEAGNTGEATRSLQLLATRLFEQGEQELARAAMEEAERVASTKVISDEGKKKIKYGTRALVHP